MSELKPCPFCNSEANIKFYEFGQGSYEVKCPNDLCPSHLAEYSEDRASKDWNTRPLEDALAARLAQAEAERDKYKAENRRLRDAIVVTKEKACRIVLMSDPINQPAQSTYDDNESACEMAGVMTRISEISNEAATIARTALEEK